MQSLIHYSTRTVMAFVLSCGLALAGEADVVDAKITKQGEHFRVDATIRSNDTGWDYYADRFDVLAPDGTILGTRILHHPHENEQPFTRSLNRLVIPAGVETVVVRASMKPDGASGDTVTLTVPSE
ncbi:MAG: hypothetical protein AAF499_05390 [Pseudomonadota bacterium]